MQELIANRSKFQIKGIVVGTNDPNFYVEGKSEYGVWNKISFGIKIKENSIIYVELLGNKRNDVKLYKINSLNEKLDYNNFIKVDWKQLYDMQGYKHSGNIEIKLSEELNLIKYDAVQYLYNYLKENNSVFVEGNINFSLYNYDLITNFIIKSISKIDDININFKNYKPFANFYGQTVFNKINSNEKTLESRIISNKKNSFIVYKYNYLVKQDLIKKIDNQIESGTLIYVHGNILNYIPFDIDMLGNKIANGSVIKGLMITGIKIENSNFNIEELDELNLLTNNSESVILENEVNEFGF